MLQTILKPCSNACQVSGWLGGLIPVSIANGVMDSGGDREGGFVAALEALAVPAIHISINKDIAPAAGTTLQPLPSDL